jgi:hypothetical protein
MRAVRLAEEVTKETDSPTSWVLTLSDLARLAAAPASLFRLSKALPGCGEALFSLERRPDGLSRLGSVVDCGLADLLWRQRTRNVAHLFIDVISTLA